MRRVVQTVILILSIVVLCSAQDSSSACDFSSYKPLIISHALLKAVVKRVEPKYPGGGHLRVQSEVELKIIVDRKGNVVTLCATRGHPLLLGSAIQAARQWKFKPNFGFTNKPKRKYVQSFIVFSFKPG
jgi:outer membrane biosynthesis protein TonB